MTPYRARGRFAPYVLGTALLALAGVLAAFALGASVAGESPGSCADCDAWPDADRWWRPSCGLTRRERGGASEGRADG